MATVYIVEQSLAQTGPWLTVLGSPFSTTTDTVTGLTPLTNYYFRITAHDTALDVFSPPTVIGPIRTLASNQESLEGTTITTLGPQINASRTPGTAQASPPYTNFALTGPSSGPYQIMRNGGLEPSPTQVLQLYYHNHTTFYQSYISNGFGTPGWWQDGGSINFWIACPNPKPVVEAIHIATLNPVLTNVGFTVTGTIDGLSLSPVLQYQDTLDGIAGGWLPLPSGASTSPTQFSFLHPGIAAAHSSAVVSVRDANNTGISANSNTFSVTAPSLNTPGPPVNLTAPSVTNASITLNWGPPTTGGALDAGSYNVQVRLANTSTWSSGPSIPMITPGHGSISSGTHVWTITTFGQIADHGVQDTNTSGATIAYLMQDNNLYYSNASGWFKFGGAAPPPPPVPPPPPPVPPPPPPPVPPPPPPPPPPSLLPTAVYQRGVDHWGTGWQQHESILNYSNVNSSQFGPVWQTSVDGNQYAQPLYLPQVVVSGNTVNAVIACTMNNTVYCLNADTGATLWTLTIGNSFNSAAQWGNADTLYSNNIGILSTPVYDNANDRLYVVSHQSRGGTINHYIDVLSVASGTRRTGSNVAVSGSNGGQTFDSNMHLQRPGLALHPTSGYLLIGFGSHQDDTPYHGWLFTYSYNGTALTRQAVLCLTPVSDGGAFWASGGPPITDENGAVYLVTGNGIGAPTPGTSASYHECTVKLTIGVGSITVADYAAPGDWASLDAEDEDFGISEPVMIPNTGAVITTGKSGVHYLAHRSSMGHVGGFARTWSYGSFPWTLAWCGATNRLYSSPVDQPIAAFQVAATGENLTFGTSPVAQTTVGFNYASYLQTSSNGTNASNALVWAVEAQGDAGRPVDGKLNCFRADTLVELYSSVENPAAGAGILNGAGGLFSLAKFTPPTVANGKVFVPTNNNSVIAFGLFGAPPPPRSPASVPGAPSSLAVPSTTTSTATMRIAQPTSGGVLDRGAYQLQYKVTAAQTWTNAPAIPYCTPNSGSFTDVYSNVWAVNSSGGVTVNGTAATSTSTVARMLLVNGVVWYQNTSANWYSYPPSGYITSPNSPALSWAGAFTTSPLMNVTITGLAQGTSYDFRVYVSNSAVSSAATATITKSTATVAPPPPPPIPPPPPAVPPPPPPVPPPPPPPASFKFITWGDTKYGQNTFTTLSNLANTFNPVFTLYSGGIWDTGWDQTQYDNWKNALGTTLFNKTFAIKGNHDAGNDAQWQGFFNFPANATGIGATNYAAYNTDLTYAFQYQNNFFVGIDGSAGDFVSSIDSATINWVDQQITAAESRGVVNTHIWTHGAIYYVDDHAASVSTAFTAMCNNHPTIKTYFHGHEHVLAYVLLNSSRISNITHPFAQFDSGTAGADLYTCAPGRSDWCTEQAGLCLVTVTGTSTKVDFYNEGGTLIKSVTV